MPSSVQQDLIDHLIQRWRLALPALDTGGTAVVGRLVRLNHFISRHVDANLGAYQLSVGEFDVLAALRREVSPYQLTPGQLQAGMLISSGGLTNRLNRLEARALIVRSADPDDRRGVLVQLTADGLALVEAVAPMHLEIERAFIKNLSTAEQDQLSMLLRKLLLTQENGIR